MTNHGGEYAVYDLVGIYSDRFRPFTEAIAIPLQIFLMVLWHMFCHSRILTRTSIQAFMRSNPSMIFKNLNRGIGHSHINLIFDILIRHRVVHLVYGDVK